MRVCFAKLTSTVLHQGAALQKLINVHMTFDLSS